VDPVVIPLHVGLLEGVIVVYDVPGAGIILPHTNTLPNESVAEIPVTVIFASPVTVTSSKLNVAVTAVTSAAPSASIVTLSNVRVAETPAVIGTNVPGSSAIETSDMALKPSISQRP
jgi:hypothetical protein